MHMLNDGFMSGNRSPLLRTAAICAEVGKAAIPGLFAL
jgi:hypothetical protein